MINWQDYSAKRIAVLGLGSENEALILWLAEQNVAIDITIYDRRPLEAIADKKEKIMRAVGPLTVSWRLGEQSYDSLEDYDELWRSPGWPIFCPQVQGALQNGRRLNSPMNLFFETCPRQRMIGITGSKGKGTTSSLIANILEAAGQPVLLGGNIGVPPFSFINRINDQSWVVLELSSFQLEDLQYSPHIAVITNIYEEHLAPADPLNPNYHKTPEDYWLAKQQIFRQQKAGDWLVVNYKLENKLDNNLINSQVKFFSELNWPSHLVGQHNQENIAAAQAVIEIIGLSEKISRQAVANFKGLEHRLEFVATKDGVSYYDDSFATNPIATTIAIKAFNRPVILLAGGADKGNNFRPLAQTIVEHSVKTVILFDGTASPRIKSDLLATGYPEEMILSAGSMDQAMQLAKQKAVDGDVVLLSTACASFGIFNNYKERGNLFKQAV
ncbi:MAG TPA: UDP-N-acetylmuramoyl-L-alanine--D-glutamate ligase [bacterium]|jgi:UDP-N-acetylmuramoylalanine--D-glutamate ligase|nr:UDP-N-acetylmuramoyl-L-alanine--D-glutamate ligase [bacterium]HNZ51510.1 UDP-N-acetylmuramoyl-L-alanine--D-glutamate ligase [bacterium]HOF79586.1 UDP-N-acetylmuramoyl-L-alanine--D-glutamate ligase [bacterium]HOH85534.1 UDP-N-acetylmuramoyl-L-alanine--D-glutamate ligase [bacterium]HOQ91441.1 UDP-N-acetylmuramoyl-L-alanine--D-glutamate ligase [bacterium]